MNITIPKIQPTAELQHLIHEPTAQNAAPSKIASVCSETLKSQNGETEKAKQNQALIASPPTQREISVFTNEQFTHWQIAENRLIDLFSNELESSVPYCSNYYKIKNQEYILTGKTKLGNKIENQISQELFPLLLTVLNSNEIQDMISSNFLSRNFTYLDSPLEDMNILFKTHTAAIKLFREKNKPKDFQNPDELYIKNIKESKMANCFELSALYKHELRKHPRAKDLPIHLYEIVNGDHVFIVITPKLGGNNPFMLIDEDAIIVDPWANSITSGAELPWDAPASALIVENEGEGCSISHFVPIVAPISNNQRIRMKL